MKRISSRLLAKVTKLQDIVSNMIDAESDALMRSDRAADVSMATGYSSSHGHRLRHRKRGRKVSFTDRIIPKISRCKN